MTMIYVASMSTQPDRDSQWVKAFSDLGVEVIPFATFNPLDDRERLLSRLQNRFHIGQKKNKLRKNLIQLVREQKADWVHFRMPLEFDASTIKEIKKLGTYTTEYFNDDPFSSDSVFGLNWMFKKALKTYDAHFVYRERNIQDFLSAGAKNVFHCPPTYAPQRHHATINDFDAEMHAENIDAAFMGHWENDQRVACIDALITEGYTMRLHGGGWNKAIENKPSSILSPVNGVYGEQYNAIYRHSKIGLCFFSKINRDTWTERPLEIIAVGGLLVCERTEEAERYFKDREEAFFFSSIEELVNITKLLVSDKELNQKTRKAGLKRLLVGKHSVEDRAILILNSIPQKYDRRY